MDYLLFLVTLLHVLAGLLFVGLPVVACAGVCVTGGRDWPVWILGLQQALMAGLFALAGGLLLAGFQWDRSFEQAWTIVGSRWIFGFMEFAFSAALMAAVVFLCPQWPERRWSRFVILATLFIAATNAWYHFPALMVVSREIRLRPELVSGLEGAVVRQLLFSPEIFGRWLHISIASVLVGGVWFRFLIGVVAEQDATTQENGSGNFLAEAWQPTDRFLRQIVWLSLLGLWLSGLTLVFQIPDSQLNHLLTLGSGKSNNLMLGILAANLAAIKTLMPETTPTGLGRFVEVGLIIAAVAAMLVR